MPTVTFIHADGIDTELPGGELLICKEVLQHLTNDDITHFLKQLSKYKHCLIVNDVDPYTNTSDNFDTVRGGYRKIDPTAPPFNVKGEKIFNYVASDHRKQVLHIQKVIE